jgi:hypothetical protein|tara:strand:+ start:309 stop:854 length:546 start_codon:yes stop_codon:yes gene_type:complete
MSDKKRKHTWINKPIRNTPLFIDPTFSLNKKEKKEYLEGQKQLQKTLDGIRERAAEDERLRYNALSLEKKEKEDEIERQYNEDYERKGAEFAKRKKQEKLRRLHKEWWEFWIEDYGRYETLSPEKKEKEDKINRQWQLDYEYKSGGGKKYLLNKDGYRYANKKRKKSLRLLHKKSWQFWIK